MTAKYICTDCKKEFEFDEKCILGFRPNQQPKICFNHEIVRICSTCAKNYESINDL